MRSLEGREPTSADGRREKTPSKWKRRKENISKGAKRRKKGFRMKRKETRPSGAANAMMRLNGI